MKSTNILAHIVPKTIATVIYVATFNTAIAGSLAPAIDDFSNPDHNSLGIQRQYVNDTVAGGQTSMEYGFEEGVFSAKGEISPPRGQPGWASTVLLLEQQGLPQDASAYKGIRLLVRVNKGNLSISANSSDITNFDYHAAQVTRQSDGEFHEVMIPFTDMKRAWSEQTKLNTKTLTSLSIIAFDIQQGSFDFEIDEVSFY